MSSEQSRVEGLAPGVSRWICGSVVLTALHLVALLATGTPRIVPVPLSTLMSPSTAVVSLTPPLQAKVPIYTPTGKPAPAPSNAPPSSSTATSAKTPTVTPLNSATPIPSATSAPTVRATPTSLPTHTPSPATRIATATYAELANPEYVPPVFAGTTLGQAVIEYNVTRPRKITMHVVSRDSEGINGEMYQDLLKRRWRIMGPEDFAASIQKPGWPYIVVAREDALNAISVAGWGYVLDHELVHIVAAANLATEGLNLAELMRNSEGTFTHEALFHEVCADFYPRDKDGNHRPVARFYGAMRRMPELLRVLGEYDSQAVAYHPPPEYQVLAITGSSLVDAACAWDRKAMQIVRDLYDEKRGPGAFNALFPSY